MILPDPIPHVTVRRYLSQDLEAIVRLDRLCFAPSFRFSRSEMGQFTDIPGAITLVAEGADGLAGFIIVDVHHPETECAYLVTIDVAESFSRQGVGSTLLLAGEAAAMEAGVDQMRLHVHTANLQAIAFYERNAYIRMTLLRDFYPDVPSGGDAFLYERTLDTWRMHASLTRTGVRE